MAIKRVLKRWLKHLTLNLFIISVAYAQNRNNTYDLTTIFLNKYVSKETKVHHKPPCTIDFDINAHLNNAIINKMKKEWQKHNTGTYTFILFTNLNGGIIPENILFVKNNKVMATLSISKNNDSFKMHRLLDRNHSKEKMTKIFRFGRSFRELEEYLPDYIFDMLTNEQWHESCYCNQFEILLEYNKKYSYITSLQTKIPSKCTFIKRRMHMHPWFIYTYGLFMLASDMEYTDETISKILKKYEQAQRCAKERLQHEARKKSKLTLLEKAVGKKRLECLDRYLVWDKNVTK